MEIELQFFIILSNLYFTKRGKYQGPGVRPRRLPFSTVGSAVRTGQIGQISAILPKHSTSLPKSTCSPRIAEGLDSLPGMAAGPRRCPPRLGTATSPPRLRAGPPRRLGNHTAAATLDCCATAFLAVARPRKPLRARVRGAREGSSTPDRQAPPGRVPCCLLLAPPPCYWPPSPPGCAAVGDSPEGPLKKPGES
jgi:hypothetical protein